jgi:RNA polymerase sigma factor (sigma-70 family)
MSLDALTLLRRDLPREPLLTAEQEQALVLRTRGEDVRVPAPGDPRPTPRAAHDRLVEANMRLVMAVARRYRGRGVPLEDLVQEGALALGRAAEGFDPERGSRFAAYAILWVREAMVRALTQDAWTIRVPPRAIARMGQIGRADERLRLRLERDPSVEEIAQELGIPAADVEEMRRVPRQPLPLEVPSLGDEQNLESTLADPAPTPEAQAVERGMNRELRGLLAALGPQERQVLALRFGIDQDRPCSPAEVGVALGLSRIQAERLELKALSQLRATQATRGLAVYLR